MNRFAACCLLLFAALVPEAAFGQIMNASHQPYSNSAPVVNATVHSMTEVRVAALSAAAGVYRSTHGVMSLNPGSTFTLIYVDGSRERGMVTSLSSQVGAAPIPGTQQEAGSGGGGGGSGGGGGGGAGGVWYTTTTCGYVNGVLDNCITETQQL